MRRPRRDFSTPECASTAGETPHTRRTFRVPAQPQQINGLTGRTGSLRPGRNRDVGTAYLFALLLGGFGAHHFYLGNIGRGIALLLLWWIGWLSLVIVIGGFMLTGAVIWYIVDMCTLPSQVRAKNATPADLYR
ncbi:TM2 domain-containing protein [Cryobacterium adonitolivorans]|uniref:TM2 domain-containing protein n=1 Tax=Cryobacterium adonitolivorans TaxID=1259189 RepID=A0A4V3ID49_9MICO|nr:TM2 domain-containing protein [Cryobacterium adonitolivorans]